MDAVKVITVDLNRILRDILVEAIEQQMQIDLLANYRSVRELEQSNCTQCPDIVLIGNSISDYSELIYRCSRAKIVCIEQDGKKVDLWQLKPYRTALGEVSPEQLADYLFHSRTDH